MVEVSEEVDRLYYGSKRSELYQHEKESKNKVVYFSNIEQGNIDDMLISVRFPDGKNESISFSYISHMTRELLLGCLIDCERLAWFIPVRDDLQFLEIVRYVENLQK